MEGRIVYEFLGYQTHDVMTREPLTIAPDAPLREAEEIFEQHNFNALPVVALGGEVIGLLSKLDILRAFRFTEDHMIPPYEEIAQHPVSSVMSRDLHCVCPRTPLTRVLEKMIDTRDKSFPVIDGEDLVGMVAREDLLRALRGAAAHKKPSEIERP